MVTQMVDPARMVAEHPSNSTPLSFVFVSNEIVAHIQVTRTQMATRTAIPAAVDMATMQVVMTRCPT